MGVNLGELPLQIPSGYTIGGMREAPGFSYLSAMNTADPGETILGIGIHHSLRSDPLAVGLPITFQFIACTVSTEGYLLRHYKHPDREDRHLVLVSSPGMVVSYLGRGADLPAAAIETFPESDWITTSWRSDSLELCLNKVDERARSK